VDKLQFEQVLRVLGAIADACERIQRAVESSDRRDQIYYDEWKAQQAKGAPLAAALRQETGPQSWWEIVPNEVDPEYATAWMQLDRIRREMGWPNTIQKIEGRTRDACGVRARVIDDGQVLFESPVCPDMSDLAEYLLKYEVPAGFAVLAGSVPAESCVSCGFGFAGRGFATLPDSTRVCYACGERTAPNDPRGALPRCGEPSPEPDSRTGRPLTCARERDHDGHHKSGVYGWPVAGTRREAADAGDDPTERR